MATALQITGVSPCEISALINHAVLEEHASDGAHLWHLRERAIKAPHYRLKQLAALDARVSAHVEGLRTAGEAGLERMRLALGDINAGTLFVAAHLAFALGDGEDMRNAVSIALAEPDLCDALIGALAWHPFESVRQPLIALGRSPDPQHRRICLATFCAHRIAAGSLLTRAAEDPDPRLRACAFRTVGELGGPDDLEHLLRIGLSDPDIECRWWAARSLALLGDTRGAVVALEVAEEGTHSRLALETAIRLGEPQWSRRMIRALAADAATLRSAVLAAGAFGDPAVIPWLLDLMPNPRFARVAAESVALVSGVDLDRSDLKQDAPDDAETGHPDDEDLRWPNPVGMRNWWAEECTRFSPGQRHLAGAPLSEDGAHHVLCTGYQRQRRAAATEIARMSKGRLLFPTGERADRQRRRLAL
jgi:uncharacterized protein (TIGR02270 family)